MPNPIKKLCFLKWSFIGQHNNVLTEQIRRTCRKHQISYQCVDKSTPHIVMINEVKSADYCLVWHGSSPVSVWGVETRKHLNKHCRIIEVGWFNQNDYWHIDKQGIGGKSTLCGELPEPSQEAWDRFEERRNWYEERLDYDYINQFKLPRDFILVPLQVRHDSTVYLDAPYKETKDLIEHVQEKFPNDPIVVKVHPKQPRESVRTDRKDVHVVKEGSFLNYAIHAKLIYGQTSTCLVESALLDLPVEAIGDCPLKYHNSTKDERDKLLATMCERQIPRDVDVDLWRFIND